MDIVELPPSTCFHVNKRPITSPSGNEFDISCLVLGEKN